MAHERNDDEDLSKLDRGDTPEGADTPEEEEEPVEKEGVDDEVERDEKGRFAKKGEAEGEPDDEDEDEDDDASGDKGDIDGDDNKNYPIRLKKFKQQRDDARRAAEQERADRAALEAELKELKEKQGKSDDKKPPEKTEAQKLDEELEALYTQVEELRLDGKAPEAAKLQRQIDAKNRQLAKLEAQEGFDQRVASVTSKLTEDQRYDAMVDFLEANIPVMTPGHKEYNPGVGKEIELLVAGYESQGISPTLALRKATMLIFRADPFAPRQQVEEEVEEEEEEHPAGKKPMKRKTDIAKSVAAAKKQPPDASTRGVNNDDTKIRVSALSEDDFEKLPESKKKELRGDNF